MVDKKYSAQTPEGKAFVKDVQDYMLDLPDANKLLGGQEATVRTIILAIKMMVSDFSTMPPLLKTFSLKEILNSGLLSPALQLTAAHVLDMKLQWQERNQTQYSDGSKTESVNDKAETYRRTSAMLRDNAKRAISEWKKSYNIQSGFGRGGGISSIYLGGNCEI